MNATDYKPSLLCRMIGHRFLLMSSHIQPKVRSYDPNEDQIIVRTWNHQSHCVRCGIVNPAFDHPANPA